MTTGRIIITGALRSLGVAAAEEPITEVMAQDSLELLNALIESYSLERLTMYVTPPTVKSLTPGVASYTWGIGGAIPTARPIQLAPQAQLREPSQLHEYGVSVLDQAQWAVIPNKAATGQPTAIYYQPSYPLGILFVFAVPTTPWDLIVYPWQALAGFVNLDTPVLFPPGYERLLRSGLTVEAAPEYGKEATANQHAILMEAKASVKRANVVVPEATVGWMR